jgi:hypothetical protein
MRREEEEAEKRRILEEEKRKEEERIRQEEEARRKEEKRIKNLVPDFFKMLRKLDMVKLVGNSTKLKQIVIARRT